MWFPIQERAAALEALSRIHDAGVLHRDPRFSNLMIQRQVRPVLRSCESRICLDARDRAFHK